MILKNIISHIYTKKTQKIGETIKIITQQPNLIENSNVIELKSVTLEHPKTSHKLSKTIKQAKKFSEIVGACKHSTSLLYREITKHEKRFWRRYHAYKGYANSYNVQLSFEFL